MGSLVSVGCPWIACRTSSAHTMADIDQTRTVMDDAARELVSR